MQQRFPALKHGYNYVNVHICITVLNIQTAFKIWNDLKKKKKKKKQTKVNSSNKAVKMSILFGQTTRQSICPYLNTLCWLCASLIVCDPGLFNTLLDLWRTLYDKNGGQNYCNTSHHQQYLQQLTPLNKERQERLNSRWLPPPPQKKR